MIGFGLCRPETPAIDMPGWATTSWGYHGDDGYIYNNPLGTGLRYSSSYTTGDMVGWGIDMRTGNLFFTRNGGSLGKDYSPIRIGFWTKVADHHLQRRRIHESERNVISYDYIWGA